MDNLEMLDEMLEATENKYYFIEKNGKEPEKKYLKLTDEKIRTSKVYLPDEVNELYMPEGDGRKIKTACRNCDSFTLAREWAKDANGKVLVLNLANPVHPGGGVRRGARAQEEDLCRKSTLLVSLEDKSASSYYEYNRSLDTYMGSDAVIITPDVEILKDEKGHWLEDSCIVSVMTCAAPMLTYGKEGMSEEEYERMMFNRIAGMIKVAANCGYKDLVLGAFGCGAFHNDAELVSKLFYEVLRIIDFHGSSGDETFERIGFAVLDRTERQYNFNSFNKYFGEGNYYKRDNFWFGKPDNVNKNGIEVIGFYGENDRYGCFSNWYKSDFWYAGVRYNCVEQYMMSQKARTFNENGLADEIMRSDDPATIKKLGRSPMENFKPDVWNRVSYHIVKRGVRAKFMQNENLKTELLETGNSILCECSPRDLIWGIGIPIESGSYKNPMCWQGKNQLGRILMEVRDEIIRGLEIPDNKSDPSLLIKNNNFPEWDTTVSILMADPKYHNAISTYLDTLYGNQKGFVLKLSIRECEETIFNDSGMVALHGFYEMVEEIYEKIICNDKNCISE